jgi:2-polyprenyl-3-methyl-5-hydroxy-6-metoxy-1,4-benzoquinol methylase
MPPLAARQTFSACPAPYKSTDLLKNFMKRSFFWERIAQRYAKSPVADESAYQQKLDTTRSFMPADAQVFEFGCGTGSTAIALAPYADHIHAIDISANMLAIARDKVANAGLTNLSFEQNTIDDFAGENESMDVILGMSILHLLKNRSTAIDKAYSLLKPGGVLVTSTVCLQDSAPWVKLIAPIARPLGLLLKVFSSADLIASMQSTGFEIAHEWQKEGSQVLFLVARKPLA